MWQLGLFAWVVLFVTILAAFMYIMIMGPSRYHRSGVVGRAYRSLVGCPEAFCACCCSIFVGCNYTRGRDRWKHVENHVVRERNHLMVAFYVLLVWSVEFVYLIVVVPTLQAPLWSKFISYALVLLSEGFYGLAVFSDPGAVTAHGDKEAQKLAFNRGIGKNVWTRRLQKKWKSTSTRGSDQSMGNKRDTRPTFLLSPDAEARLNKKYALDGILYSFDGLSALLTMDNTSDATQISRNVGVQCNTCHISRPSRSKHCRLCNRCVRRYDHHCPWINNDVAEGTHRWFLLFLLCHAISCTWASWDLCSIIKEFLVQHRLWGWTLKLADGRIYQITLLDYLSIIVHYQTLTACLLLFALMIGLVLWAFWIYQMSFVLQNVTMNDMNKIDDAVLFVTSLSSLHDVYREVTNVRNHLVMVAARPPRGLLQLDEPSPSTLPGSRADKLYRKKVRQLLYRDLKGIFDRGAWNNLKEVLFPYS